MDVYKTLILNYERSNLQSLLPIIQSRVPLGTMMALSKFDEPMTVNLNTLSLMSAIQWLAKPSIAHREAKQPTKLLIIILGSVPVEDENMFTSILCNLTPTYFHIVIMSNVKPRNITSFMYNSNGVQFFPRNKRYNGHVVQVMLHSDDIVNVLRRSSTQIKDLLKFTTYSSLKLLPEEVVLHYSDTI